MNNGKKANVYNPKLKKNKPKKVLLKKPNQLILDLYNNYKKLS